MWETGQIMTFILERIDKIHKSYRIELIFKFGEIKIKTIISINE